MNDLIIESKEIHKAIKRKFTKRPILVSSIDDVWSIDLIDLSQFKKQNNNYSYILSVIDNLSKYLWCKKLKTKKAQEVLNAFKSIITERKPNKIHCDKGSEFYNKLMKDFLSKNNIQIYSVYGDNKSPIVERLNRTIKQQLWIHFDTKYTNRWIDIIDKIVSDYNN